MKKTIVAFFILSLCLLTADMSHSESDGLSHEATATEHSVRIIGGGDADAWPFMATLVLRNQSALSGFFCGGSLVSPGWVVTAAHCVEDLTAGSLEVLIGAYDLNNDDGQRFNVENIFTHPLYIPFSEFPENDIALLELEPSSLDLESTIDPVSDDMSLEGLDGIILGWGNTVPNVSSKSPVLQQANVPIVSNSDCEFAYYDYSPNPIADTMVCAGDYVNGEVDTCQGDSGGPLLIDEGEGNIKLAGVTSWGIGCAQPGFYGVYTRVSEFLDFIGQNFIIAKAGPDQTVRNGSVTLNAGQSHIPEGATAEYEWKLQSRTCIAATCDATANGEITTVANLKNGIYDVTLTVTDGELTDTDVMVVNSCFIMSAIY